jgi:serine/threonine protein kinase
LSTTAAARWQHVAIGRPNRGSELCWRVVDLKEGQLVTPTLRLNKLLGQGGMGSVWLAEHLALQTQVAVKFLSPEMASSPDAIERFKREATAAAQIRSPHVVQTLDHGITTNGVPFIVLELLEGEELGARMEREPRLPLGLVAQVVSQACKALSKAHSLSIVHRDIKPENIYLVDVDGEPFVKVLDFGIAKRTDGASLKMTSTNAMIGTPYYMSPEQAFSSKDVDGRTDLWALAVVAYYALVGDVPFQGETVGAICIAIDRATYTPVTRLRPELPATLDDWFARAFARKIDKRFASAREMADAFLVAAGDEVSGPMSSVWASRGGSAVPPSPARSRWLVPSLFVAILLALGGGLALGLARSSEPANAAATSSTSAPAPTQTTATTAGTTTSTATATSATPPTTTPPTATPPTATPPTATPPTATPPTTTTAPAVATAPATSAEIPATAAPPAHTAPKKPPEKPEIAVSPTPAASPTTPPSKPPPAAPADTKDRGF